MSLNDRLQRGRQRDSVWVSHIATSSSTAEFESHCLPPTSTVSQRRYNSALASEPGRKFGFKLASELFVPGLQICSARPIQICADFLACRCGGAIYDRSFGDRSSVINTLPGILGREDKHNTVLPARIRRLLGHDKCVGRNALLSQLSHSLGVFRRAIDLTSNAICCTSYYCKKM